jgi:predicted GNAT family N-acyltransferase
MDVIKIINTDVKYADSFCKTLDTVAREEKYLAMTEGPSLENVRGFVKCIIENDDIQLYAVLNDEVIGWCDIGAKLLTEALKQAKEKKFEKVTLEVFAGNTNAVNLYKKFGFITEGLKKNDRKLNDEYDDNVIMGFFIKELVNDNR